MKNNKPYRKYWRDNGRILAIEEFSILDIDSFMDKTQSTPGKN